MITTLTKHLLSICHVSLNKDYKASYNRFWIIVDSVIITYTVQDGVVWCDKRKKKIYDISEI